jgi:hypothetical protein
MFAIKKKIYNFRDTSQKELPILVYPEPLPMQAEER